MATETIDIIVRENGARVVKRRLEEIGDVAQRSVRGLRLLQNALFVLGGAGLLSALGRMVDTVANFQNRLSLLTTDAREAAFVQRELFDIARRTRAEFDTTAQIYTRTALAVRALGVSQQETLNFTESLNQATILSGASVREANAALIQMSQALASNRFSGDEFRSVAEQLPFIIDVIGDHLGVTRGEVRELGIQGKLTASVILAAFREAREEIAEKFARTIPTLSQSFTVFRTRLTEVIGTMDQSLGISRSLAAAVILIADNLEFLVGGIIAATAAFAAFKFTGWIAGIVAVIQKNRELAAAVASGNAVLLTSVEIERAKAATALQTASATAAQAAAKVRDIQLDVSQLQTQRALLLQQQASIKIDAQRRVARDALTGRFIAYNAAVAQNIRTNVALQRTETALLASKAALTQATTAQTAATTALTAAQSRAAVAGAAANTWTARLSRAFPGLASVIGMAARALGGLWALIAAHPIGAVIAALVALVAGLAIFSDKIGVADDGLVTLRDVGVATFQLIREAIAPVGQFLIDTFRPAIDWVVNAWNWLVEKVGEALMAILGLVKAYINFQIGLWDGLISSVIRAWDLFPAAFGDVLIMAYNAMIQFVEDSVNGFIEGFLSLPRRAKEVFEAVANFGRDALNYIVEAFRALPGAIAALADQAATFLKNKFVEAINYVIDLLNNLPGIAIDAFGEVGTAVQDAFTLPPPPDFSQYINEGRLDLSSLKRETTGAAREVGQIFSEEFSRSLNTDYIGNAWNAVLERARQLAAERTAAVAASGDGGGPPGGSGSGSGKGKSFEEIIRELTTANELLRVNAAERDKLQAIIRIEEQMKRSLTETERELVRALLDENELLTKAAELYEDIKGPIYNYRLELEALNELLRQGRINQDEFNRSVLNSRITFLNTQTDMASGFERGFLKILQKTGDLAKQTEDIITKAFDGMSQAIADLVVDGEADFGSLIKSINKMIIQLVISQAFQQLFGGFGGGGLAGSGNMFSGLFQGIKGLFGFQDGGQFRVGGGMGFAPIPNGGNDNRLVAFRAQDGETVTVTPKGKQPSGGGNQSVVVNFNISTPNVESFRQSESQLAAKAARLISQGRRNM